MRCVVKVIYGSLPAGRDGLSLSGDNYTRFGQPAQESLGEPEKIMYYNYNKIRFSVILCWAGNNNIIYERLWRVGDFGEGDLAEVLRHYGFVILSSFVIRVSSLVLPVVIPPSFQGRNRTDETDRTDRTAPPFKPDYCVTGMSPVEPEYARVISLTAQRKDSNR